MRAFRLYHCVHCDLQFHVQHLDEQDAEAGIKHCVRCAMPILPLTGVKQETLDGGFSPEELDLLNAGRELATIAEDDITFCGNSPPHPDNCPDCADARDAIHRWARAVCRFRKAREEQLAGDQDGPLVKMLAIQAHALWSKWMDHLFRESSQRVFGTMPDGTPARETIIPGWATGRWMKRMCQMFGDLDADTKQAYLDEARKILALVRDYDMDRPF